MYLILLKSVVHEYARGTLVSTRLVYAMCVVAFVDCINGDNFSVMRLTLLKSVVNGYARGMSFGTCLVYVTCVVAFVACINGDNFL